MKSKVYAILSVLTIITLIMGLNLLFNRPEVPPELAVAITIINIILTGYYLDEWRKA